MEYIPYFLGFGAFVIVMLGILGMPQLFDDDRALKSRLPDQHAAVDVAHPARAKCLDDLVLGAF